MRWHIYTPAGRYLGDIEPRMDWCEYMIRGHGRLSLAVPSELSIWRGFTSADLTVPIKRVDLKAGSDLREMIDRQSAKVIVIQGEQHLMAFPEFADKEGRRVLERAEAKASEAFEKASLLRRQADRARREFVYAPAADALEREAVSAMYRAHEVDREVEMLRQMVAENMAKHEDAA